MARKKVSKKDLKKGVTRLSKEIEKTTTRLKRQKSGLKRTLASIQKQLDHLQRKKASKSKLSSQARHQRDLGKTTKALVSKLGRLERGTLAAERTGDELNKRIAVLERAAAEVNHWRQDINGLTSRLDDRTKVLPKMKKNLGRLTYDLNKLWAHVDRNGVGPAQQAEMASLLGQSRDELGERIEALANELRAPGIQAPAQDEPRDGGASPSADMAGIQDALEALAGRVQEQADNLVGFDMRLHDLEQVGSVLERFADEFGARVEALETSAAEAKRDGEELAHRTVDLEDRIQALPLLQERVEVLQSQLQLPPTVGGQGDRGLDPVIDALGQRTEAVEEQLKRLSDVQENLELQTALLSRQAEDGSGAALPVASEGPLAGQPGPTQRPEALVAEVQRLLDKVTQQARDSAELSAQYQRLEAAAAKLSEVQQALSDRVDQIQGRMPDQQPGPVADDPQQLAQLLPGLADRCSRIEEAAGNLDRRTAVLEARSESLARQDAQISSEIQAVHQHLSDLSTGSGKPIPAMPAVAQADDTLQSLEQQLISLTADQSANHSHLEAFLSRTEALEQASSKHAEQSEAMSGRLASLSEGLQGLLTLKAGQRLDDLDFRADALEQSLHLERSRIDELQQAGAELAEKMVGGDVQTLEALAGKLSSDGERLDGEVGRLSAELKAAGENVRQQQEQLQVHDARLVEQQQYLDDAINGHIKTADGLSQRLGALDDSHQGLQQRLGTMDDTQQALQDATASLGVQQTRQANETQNLQQSLKQRSLLGLLTLFLVAAAIGYLLFRTPMQAVAPQQVLQSPPSEVAPAAVPAALESEIADMRVELSRLGDSVLRVSDSLGQLDAAVVPELPAQLSGLKQAMETLTQDNLRQQQESTRLVAVQEKLQAEMDKMAGEAKGLQEQVAAYPALEDAAEVIAGQRWAKAQHLGHYTVQVVGARKRNSLGWFVKHHGIEQRTAVYRSASGGGYWYVLLHGIYETREQAQAAVEQLPTDLAVHGPWVRRIPERGVLLPL